MTSSSVLRLMLRFHTSEHTSSLVEGRHGTESEIWCCEFELFAAGNDPEAIACAVELHCARATRSFRELDLTRLVYQ